MTIVAGARDRRVASGVGPAVAQFAGLVVDPPVVDLGRPGGPTVTAAAADRVALRVAGPVGGVVTAAAVPACFIRNDLVVEFFAGRNTAMLQMTAAARNVPQGDVEPLGHGRAGPRRRAGREISVATWR